MKRIVSFALSLLLLVTAVLAIPVHEVKAESTTEIHAVDLWVKPPVEGDLFSYQTKKEINYSYYSDRDWYDVLELTMGSVYDGVAWKDEDTGEFLTPESLAIEDHVYSVNIFLATQSEFAFAEDLRARINERTAEIVRISDQSIMITQIFTAKKAVAEVVLSLPEPKAGDRIVQKYSSEYTEPEILSVNGEAVNDSNYGRLSEQGPGPSFPVPYFSGGQVNWIEYTDDWFSKITDPNYEPEDIVFAKGKRYICLIDLITAFDRAFDPDCAFILNGSSMTYFAELEPFFEQMSYMPGKFGISIRFYYSIFTVPFSAPKPSSVAANNSGVVFKWSKVTGAEKYRVYRKAEGETSWKKLGDTTSTSYTDKTAKTGKSYTYTVRCVSADGKTNMSTYNKTGLTITYCAKPKLVSATNYNGGVKVTWKTSKGAAKYRILRKEKGGTSWKSIGYAGSTKTTYKDTTVKSGKTYIYTVRCVTSDKSAYTSGYDTTGTKVAYIAAPVLKTPTIVTGGIKVAWKKSEGAKQYRILRKEKGATKWKSIGYAGASKTTYTDKTVKKGKTYIYSVRCMNADKTKYTSSYDSTGKTIKYK